ncbi:MAG: hypothetical protein LC777_01865 [Actinobacteria bacterium]|nr:hypothetical protein [Actinomycetota bacterium]
MKPTPKQLAYLKSLAEATETTFYVPEEQRAGQRTDPPHEGAAAVKRR